jgi:hypothetical protein
LTAVSKVEPIISGHSPSDPSTGSIHHRYCK